MARKKSRKPSSRSAMGKQEDEAERRRKDVPMFSFEGLRVHWKTLAGVSAALFIALIASVLVVGAVTSAANFEVTLSADFVQAKAGSTVTFDATVQNTAQLSPFAYETHLVNLPPGWTVVQGEDLFGLAAGESRVVRVEVLAAGSTPPNHDYPIELKVIAKTPDGSQELGVKAAPVTVKLLGSDIEVEMLEHGTSLAFEGNTTQETVQFTACGTPQTAPALLYPAAGLPTAAGVSFRLAGPDLNATGYIEVDLGADGTFDGNRTLNSFGDRFNLPPDVLAEWAEAHPASGPNATVPLSFRSCTNATGGWNVTFDAPLVSYLAPLGEGGSYAVSFDLVDQPSGSAVISLRVTNHEARDLTAVVSLPDLPERWTTSLPAGGSPLTLEANGGWRTTEFTVSVAKTAAEGPNPVEVSACLQGNANDCSSTTMALEVGKTQYFEVKTYLEPVSIRTTYISRSTDVLLFARNLGNQPVSLIPSVDLNVPDVTSVFWYYDVENGEPEHVMVTDENVTLAVGEARFLVLRVRVSPTAAQSVAQVHPNFQGTENGQVQNLFLNIQISPFPAPPSEGPTALGDNLTVEYTVSAADGALLYKTNQVAFTQLIDSGARPTHPNFTKLTASGYSPYQYTLKNESAYRGTVHEGFEPLLAGAYREEVFVFWLSPDQTMYPAGHPLRNDYVVVQVKVVGLEQA